MASEGHEVRRACRLMEVSSAGFYAWRDRPPSPTAVRRAWLTDLIVEIHGASRETYGAPRVHAELRLGRGVVVGKHTIAALMRNAGIQGLPVRKRFRRNPNIANSADLVERRFDRAGPNELWVTDITEHPTREGKLYCAVVLDTFSRRVVGWSIDSSQTSTLVTSALGMAIQNRAPDAGTVIHSDHGVQFNSWAFTRRAQESGLLASMGSVGDCFDNAVIESFWGRIQVELLNRQRWRTRVELANAMFEYLEIFHNRQRRHTAIGMHTPIEYERLHLEHQPVA